MLSFVTLFSRLFCWAEEPAAQQWTWKHGRHSNEFCRCCRWEISQGLWLRLGQQGCWFWFFGSLCWVLSTEVSLSKLLLLTAPCVLLCLAWLRGHPDFVTTTQTYSMTFPPSRDDQECNRSHNWHTYKQNILNRWGCAGRLTISCYFSVNVTTVWWSPHQCWTPYCTTYCLQKQSAAFMWAERKMC